MLNGMLRNTLLIAKREYVERIRSRVFRITTLLVPIGMGGLAVLGSLSGKKMEGVQNMAIVSSNPELAEEVKAALLDGELPPKTVDIYAPATDEDLARLNSAVAAHQIGGYLKLDPVAGEERPEVTWISGSSINFVSKAQMDAAVSSALIREQLLQRGVPEAQVEGLMKDPKLTTMQVKNGSVVEANSERSFLGAYILIIVLYASVLIYGINIARSVVEEKTSRIFEVLLSTASADSLMLGKLLGVGAVGLTQMAIWGALLVFYAGSAMAAAQGIHGLGSLGITKAELGYFGIFFCWDFPVQRAGSSAGVERERRAGGAAVQLHPDFAAGGERGAAAVCAGESEFDGGGGAVAPATVHAHHYVHADLLADAAAVADCAVDRAAGGIGVGDGVAGGADLPGGRADVREARDAAGDDPVAKVQLRGAMAGFTAQEAEIWQPGAGILI
jgi:ABC-2 type transport system permease protein